MSDEVLDGEVTRLYKRDGGVRASVVLDESRPEEAPLHDRFEWRDPVAAEQYRLTQARRMVKAASVTLSDGHRERLVNIPSPTYSREGVYRVISAVPNDADEFKRAYVAAVARLEGARRNLEALERVADNDAENAEIASIRAALSALSVAEDALRAH